jgi:hypothetical protein
VVASALAALIFVWDVSVLATVVVVVVVASVVSVAKVFEY